MDKENINSELCTSLESHLQCPLVVETLNEDGSTGKRTAFKKATLSLARNEFREIILLLNAEKERLQYSACNVILHGKFIKEGKATVVLNNRVRIFISNCAVDKLIIFLKTLSSKTSKAIKNNIPDIRKRLMSERKRTLTEISPLTANEVNSITNRSSVKNVELTPPGAKKMRLDNIENRKCRLDISRPLLETNLSEEQKMILNVVLSGKNIFFTGSAGTGKSHLLKKIIRILPPASTFITASTGVAAMQIGGVTLHSFAGIELGTASLETTLKKIQTNNAIQNWKTCQHLIVDEISMIDGDYFAKLEEVARCVRKENKPFGGIQLIVCGDFLQLPPVTKQNAIRTFCFETDAWKNCVKVNMELKKIYRQQDKQFITILQAIRLGVCTDKMTKILLSTNASLGSDEITATRLCTHNENVSFINLERLNSLPGESREFVAIDSDVYLTDYLDKHCPAQSRLKLKIGTQVMLLRNYDFQKGLVNGSRGIVVQFSKQTGFPVVKFKSGETVTITHYQWTVKTNGNNQVTRRQLPLKLAWALSIHKAQGMTLDCVEMSLAKVFECGQAYVGLSRASSLKGLRVLDFDKRCVRAHSTVLDFYRHMKFFSNI